MMIVYEKRPIILQFEVLESVCVRLSGSDAVHFNEVRVEFGFGGESSTVASSSSSTVASSSSSTVAYSWFLSELSGWIDGPDADNAIGVRAKTPKMSRRRVVFSLSFGPL